jgi:hypothetical protein
MRAWSMAEARASSTPPRYDVADGPVGLVKYTEYQPAGVGELVMTIDVTGLHEQVRSMITRKENNVLTKVGIV